MTTVLISGANRGIGLEFVRQYVADGTHVIAGVRDPASADALQQLAREHEGRVEILPLDAGDTASMAAFREAVGERPVDVVIANAGVTGGARQNKLGDIDYEAWLDTFNVNTLGPVRLAEAFAANLQAGEGKKLVAITSMMGSTAENGGGMLSYRSSKAALNNVWKGLSETMKKSEVACAVYHPGWVKTDMGGESAQITPEESVTGLRTQIAALDLAHTGRYVNWDGSERPW